MSKSLTPQQNKAYYNKKATVHRGHFVSWWDTHMKKIEVDTLSQFIRATDFVLDVGCSNGASTAELQQKTNARFHGIDYSSLSIKQAKKIKNASLSFECIDILKFRKHALYDKVISIRCLINLMTYDRQLQALQIIHKALKPNGLYIMCEGFIEGLKNLNKLRVLFELKPLSIPYHNLYFSEKKLERDIAKLFRVKKTIKHASIYYLGTRLLQYISLQENQKIIENSDWNSFFEQFGYETKHSGDFSPNKVLMLQKI